MPSSSALQFSDGGVSPVRMMKATCCLGHGDILVMGGQCQDEFLHRTDPGGEQERPQTWAPRSTSCSEQTQVQRWEGCEQAWRRKNTPLRHTGAVVAECNTKSRIGGAEVRWRGERPPLPSSRSRLVRSRITRTVKLGPRAWKTEEAAGGSRGRRREVTSTWRRQRRKRGGDSCTCERRR